MISYLKRQHCTFPHRILSAFIAFSFLGTSVLPPGSYAQVMPASVLNLPVAGTMVQASTGFTPARLIGITIHPDNPLKFDFIVNSGDAQLAADALKEESRKLIKYFLAALTTPEDELWVNLSPYEKDRMIPQGLGQTEMGRDMLAQDYLLKQLTASLMYPEKELGKKFWDRIYKRAKEEYGTAEIPVNTFNKVWVVPQEAVVYEKDSSAFVVKSRLKVMLEQDYEASRYNQSDTGSRTQEDNAGARDEAQKVDSRSSILDTRGTSSIKDQGSNIETAIIKEVIIPEIEKEINEGKNFATLRQMYNSLILAAWYKIKLKDGLLAKVYVNKNKTKGIATEDKEINQKIYEQYIESFKKGVYNYIKEDTDPATSELVPRKYFSGGLGFGQGITAMVASALLVLGASSGPVETEFMRSIPLEGNSNIEVILGENPVNPNVFETIESSVDKLPPAEARPSFQFAAINESLELLEQSRDPAKVSSPLDVYSIAHAIHIIGYTGLGLSLGLGEWYRQKGEKATDLAQKADYYEKYNNVVPRTAPLFAGAGILGAGMVMATMANVNLGQEWFLGLLTILGYEMPEGILNYTPYAKELMTASRRAQKGEIAVDELSKIEERGQRDWGLKVDLYMWAAAFALGLSQIDIPFSLTDSLAQNSQWENLGLNLGYLSSVAGLTAAYYLIRNKSSSRDEGPSQQGPASSPVSDGESTFSPVADEVDLKDSQGQKSSDAFAREESDSGKSSSPMTNREVRKAIVDWLRAQMEMLESSMKAAGQLKQDNPQMSLQLYEIVELINKILKTSFKQVMPADQIIKWSGEFIARLVRLNIELQKMSMQKDPFIQPLAEQTTVLLAASRKVFNTLVLTHFQEKVYLTMTFPTGQQYIIRYNIEDEQLTIRGKDGKTLLSTRQESYSIGESIFELRSILGKNFLSEKDLIAALDATIKKVRDNSWLKKQLEKKDPDAGTEPTSSPVAMELPVAGKPPLSIRVLVRKNSPKPAVNILFNWPGEMPLQTWVGNPSRLSMEEVARRVLAELQYNRIDDLLSKSPEEYRNLPIKVAQLLEEKKTLIDLAAKSANFASSPVGDDDKESDRSSLINNGNGNNGLLKRIKLKEREVLRQEIVNWQTEGIDKVAHDLATTGLEEFIVIGSEKSMRFNESQLIYQHKNSQLQIIEKRYLNPQTHVILKGLMAQRPDGVVPTLFNPADNNHYYEIYLPVFGYFDLEEIVVAAKGQIKEGTRRWIIENVRKFLYKNNDEIYIHGHLHDRNMLILLDANNKIRDVKFIDFKELRTLNLEKHPELKKIIELIKVDRRAVLNEKFSGIKLRDLKLEWLDYFRGLDMFGADLEDSYFTGSDLSNINLQKANLLNAKMMWVNLMGANMRGANMRNINLEFAKLDGADLQGADLYTELGEVYVGLTEGTILRNASLRKVNLRGTDLRNVDFENADLRESDLRGAKLPALGHFQGARLDGALVDEDSVLAQVKGVIVVKRQTEEGRNSTSSPISNAPGGIDLNPALLDLQIKRDGNGVPLPLPQQPIETMHIDGFVPIIINVTPIPSLPVFLGLNTEGEEEPLHSTDASLQLAPLGYREEDASDNALAYSGELRHN